MRIGRRGFMKGVAGVSSLALASGIERRWAWAEAPELPLPANAPLRTVVVNMMENRSLDHMLNFIPGIDSFKDAGGFSVPTTLNPDGSVPADAEWFDAYHSTAHCNEPDPRHGWGTSRTEFNRGRNDGFYAVDQATGPVALGYYEEADLPFMGALARNYTTFSRYFCSLLAPTYPNRYYLHSAQSGGEKTNDLNRSSTRSWPLIWDLLEASGVSWGYFFVDLPVIGLWGRTMTQYTHRIFHISEYYAMAAAGRLPAVCYIDPGFVAGNDDHPAHDTQNGQRYIYDTFAALASGPQWKHAAYIVTYDEHGGFFDHVPPPRVPDDREDAANLDEDFGQLGFRVPTIVASPFTRGGFVGHNVYDHASVLKLIEWRWLGGTYLTRRDRYANNLAEIFDFENPDYEVPDLPVPDLHLQGFACGGLSTGRVAHEVEESPAGEVLHHDTPGVPAPYPGSVVPHAARPDVPHTTMIELADGGYFGAFDLRGTALRDAYL